MFIDAFLGKDETGEKSTKRLENLFFTVVTRFGICLARDMNHFSGYYALELLNSIMRRVASVPELSYLKWPIGKMLFKFNYYIDDLINKAFKILSQRETSIQMGDRAVIVTLKTQRLLIIDYFCSSVAVSVGQRRQFPDMLNPRIIDILVTWIKEQFGNAFVMVDLKSTASFHRLR